MFTVQKTVVYYFKQKNILMLMVNKKLGYLQFVHSVAQVYKGCPNTRRPSKCEKGRPA